MPYIPHGRVFFVLFFVVVGVLFGSWLVPHSWNLIRSGSPDPWISWNPTNGLFRVCFMATGINQGCQRAWCLCYMLSVRQSWRIWGAFRIFQFLPQTPNKPQVQHRIRREREEEKKEAQTSRHLGKKAKSYILDLHWIRTPIRSGKARPDPPIWGSQVGKNGSYFLATCCGCCSYLLDYQPHTLPVDLSALSFSSVVLLLPPKSGEGLSQVCLFRIYSHKREAEFITRVVVRHLC